MPKGYMFKTEAEYDTELDRLANLIDQWEDHPANRDNEYATNPYVGRFESIMSERNRRIVLQNW